MATTVTYKGQTLATVENATKTLQTAGTWCEDDFTLTDVTQGGGGDLGGLADMVDVSDQDYNFGYMLSAMKNGDTVGGTVTYTANFPNTEELLLSTGLSEIHGFMFVNPAMNLRTASGSAQTNHFLVAFVDSNDTNSYIGTYAANVARSYNNANGANIQAVPINGTLRIDGGDLYYTARYNRNANYQILASNTLYEWLAW